jgi:hyperosmotically inducible protein
MKIIHWLEGAAVGAVAMYYCDPKSGKRRRQRMADAANHQLAVKKRALAVMQRDFENRARGVGCAIQEFGILNAVDDHVLELRVIAAIGRFTAHARRIAVRAENGAITLAGAVAPSEMPDIMRCVKRVSGVKAVDDRTDPVDDGQQSKRQPRSRWLPAQSLVAVAGGALMAFYGATRRGPIASLVAGAGTALMAKAFRDTEHRFDPDEAARNAREKQVDLVERSIREFGTKGST